MDEVVGMAEDINSCIRMTLEEFEFVLKNLSKIKPREALDYLDEALIYFNHHVKDGKILQIYDTNCVNVVQKIKEYLKTGKISKAAVSNPQTIFSLRKLIW